MHRALAVAAALIAPAALATKPTLPIQITADLRGNGAAVKVVYGMDVPEGDIQAWGLDGLEVEGAAPGQGGLKIRRIHHGPLKKGAVVEFNLRFTPGKGQSHLTVAADGAVAGWSFGARSEEQKRENQRGTTRDAEGNWIKIMNPDEGGTAAQPPPPVPPAPPPAPPK